MKPLPILSAAQLFEHCKLDPALRDIRQQVGLDVNVFNVLYTPAIYAYAELVQLAPASESHHHAGPGGLLIHTLDAITLALRKRRGYQLPLGGSIQQISLQRHLWTYAVFVGCLLHDIGKLSANTRLIAIRKDGSDLAWTPQYGPLTKMIDPTTGRADLKQYRIEFRKTPYDYHAHLALLHWDLIPQQGRTWLIEASGIMAELIAWLWGDRFESGVIGEIVEFADRESTAKNLQIPSSSQRFSNQISAIDRYMKLLRHWIQNNAIRININGGMGWVDNTGHLYIVCRSLAEKLIQECNQIGLRNLPQDPIRVYDILQEHGYAIPTEDGKAIHTIEIKTASYTHQFTCLKFEARRLTTPTRILSPLEGEIHILENAEKTQQEPPVKAETTMAEGQSRDADSEEPVIKAEETIGDDQDAAATAAGKTPLDTAPGAATETHGTAETEPPITAIMETETPAEHSVPDTVPDSAQPAQEPATPNGPISDRINILENLDYEATDTPKKFLTWLQQGILEKTIKVNDINSEVHIVEEGVFLLAPAIFKTFLRLHGFDQSKHGNLSRRFARLRRHIREGDFNIHNYWVKSSNKASKINGWLLPFNVIYDDGAVIPKKNKYIDKDLKTG